LRYQSFILLLFSYWIFVKLLEWYLVWLLAVKISLNWLAFYINKYELHMALTHHRSLKKSMANIVTLRPLKLIKLFFQLLSPSAKQDNHGTRIAKWATWISIRVAPPPVLLNPYSKQNICFFITLFCCLDFCIIVWT